MGKENIVDIKGGRYRYHYDPESQKTVYDGPVGSSPEIGEDEFNMAIARDPPATTVEGFRKMYPNLAQAIEEISLRKIEWRTGAIDPEDWMWEDDARRFPHFKSGWGEDITRGFLIMAEHSLQSLKEKSPAELRDIYATAGIDPNPVDEMERKMYIIDKSRPTFRGSLYDDFVGSEDVRGLVLADMDTGLMAAHRFIESLEKAPFLYDEV